MILRLPFLGLLTLLAACTPRPAGPPPRLTLAPVDFAELAGWRKDRLVEALPALLNSCAALARLPGDAPLGPAGTGGRAADWRATCAAAAKLPATDEAAMRRFLEAELVPFMAGDNSRDEGIFTGYYEAELRGARHRGGRSLTPLLKRPPDLVMVDLGRFRPAWRGERIAGRVVAGRLEPYETRAAIEAGALDRYHLELLWVDDPVDAFFLQIQGSGRVRLADGSIVRIGYDGQNGAPYVPIGRLLVERGALEADAVSMQSIRAWLEAHPQEGRAVMAENPSYVFFREVAGDGPVGAEGVVLTPGRSLAVDRDFIPLGVPVWLDAEDAGDGDGPIRRLLVAQDTGGAIRGPVRGDVFWGYGPAAAARAGRMKARGRYFLLLPRRVAARLLQADAARR